VRKDPAEVQELKNPSRIRKEQSSGGTTSRRTRSRELRVESSQRREERKRSRPLRTGNSSKSRKKVQKLRREHSRRQIGWRKEDLDRWKVFTSRKEAQEERTGRTDLDRQILSGDPTVVGSTESCRQGVNLVNKEEKSLGGSPDTYRDIEASGVRISTFPWIGDRVSPP
jgi:hypothetical protein